MARNCSTRSARATLRWRHPSRTAFSCCCITAAYARGIVFSVLMKIRNEYLWDFCKNSFEDHYCKFFQLERLMQGQSLDLHNFSDLNLEAHMYEPQWFLTPFTVEFPLRMVFHITDLLLCEGLNIIFHAALALLKTSKGDFLQAEFEGT